jgi:hypothetical protein
VREEHEQCDRGCRAGVAASAADVRGHGTAPLSVGRGSP